MAAIVHHGLQSCLDSHLVESTTLRLAINPTFSRKTESHGWSFLQALSNNVSHGPLDRETAYVPPQLKRNSMAMSEKSLELCTERLGNETGSDIVESEFGYGMMEDLLCSSSTRNKEKVKPPRQQGCLGGRKMRNRDFPPPLTTISGSNCVRVRPHREDGRLVIEAIRVPPSGLCFRAERSHGRLRLCFLKDCNFDREEENEGEYSDGEEEEEEEEEKNEEEEEVEEEEEIEEEDGGGGEREMRREKYEIERPRRCKEGGEHENNDLLMNWGEPLWVAIS